MSITLSSTPAATRSVTGGAHRSSGGQRWPGALRNTHANRYRAAQGRPQTRQLFDHDAPASSAGSVSSREILEAVARAPAKYRDAVISVDLLGLSYREAACALNTSEATLTTRLHRGRQHVARQLVTQTATAY